MKFFLLVSALSLSLLILTGCGNIPTPKNKTNLILDKSLPTITLTDNGVILGIKSVAFEWNSITNPNVKGINIYKMDDTTDYTTELSYYNSINSRFSTHYVDNDVEPDTKYTYIFKTFSAIGECMTSRKITINTLPVIKSVSWIHSITDMPRVAKIIWRPHTNQRVESYIIERKTFKDIEWVPIDTISGRLSAEYIDKYLNDNFVYMYRLRAITYDEITSTPSEIVKVVTKALPNPILNITASTNLPKTISLKWDKSLQEDLFLYYIYRSSNLNYGYQLIVKTPNNTFIDKIKGNGKTYFYRVSAVDIDNLESPHSKTSILGMTLSPPKAPSITNAKHIGNNIEITWIKTDPRSVSFSVIRRSFNGWFDIRIDEFSNIKGNQFLDHNIEADTTYSYVIHSIDIHGLKSKKSLSLKIIIPKEKETINSNLELL